MVTRRRSASLQPCRKLFGPPSRSGGLFLFLTLLALASPALAQSGDNVLLIVNETSADSGRIAETYARARGVPQTQLLRIKVDAAADEIERAVFNAQIQAPIAEWIRRNSAQDRILFIVLTKGIPLRVKGTSGRGGTIASVDSELTLLYRRLAGGEPSLVGPLANPYFLGDTAVAQAKTFSHQAYDIYLVTRLDGYSVDDVLKVIERGAAPVQEALRIDPAVAKSDEVKALQGKVGKK